MDELKWLDDLSTFDRGMAKGITLGLTEVRTLEQRNNSLKLLSCTLMCVNAALLVVIIWLLVR